MRFSRVSLPFIIMLMLNAADMYAQSTSGTNGVYRIKEIIDSFPRHDKPKTKILYRRVFDYDKQGKPLTYTGEYYSNGKLKSSAKMVYAYDNGGRLISKTGDKQNYKYYYDKDGRLSRITLYIDGNKSIVEETFLEEKKNENGQRHLLYTMNKLRISGIRKDSVDNYCRIEYIIDAGNNILKSTVYTYNFFKLKSPLVYSYTYDEKPNPLQQIFIERWFEFDLENRGLTNLKAKKLGEKVAYSRVYEYNNLGYPVKCTINNHRTVLYRYERIEVTSEITSQPLNTLTDKMSVSIYPNPASTEVTLSAESIGNGKAELTIFDLNGRVVRRVNYSVTNRLEAIIPLAGIVPGLYVIEFISPNIKERKKLIVQ